MPAPLPSLIGQRFGRLTVIDGPFKNGKKRSWKSICDCGNESVNQQTVLRRGEAISCGCFRKEITKAVHQVHGKALTPEYKVWAGLKDRCTNTNSNVYGRYGGRGIQVCESWYAFENFMADMGERPSAKHSLDRIDNDGDYKPSNCRWATHKQQCRNKSNNVFFDTEFGRLTAPEMAEHKSCVVSETTLRYRLERGWDFTSAMQTPLMKNQFTRGAI
jgi:hypothetical protein